MKFLNILFIKIYCFKLPLLNYKLHLVKKKKKITIQSCKYPYFNYIKYLW